MKNLNEPLNETLNEALNKNLLSTKRSASPLPTALPERPPEVTRDTRKIAEVVQAWRERQVVPPGARLGPTAASRTDRHSQLPAKIST